MGPHSVGGRCAGAFRLRPQGAARSAADRLGAAAGRRRAARSDGNRRCEQAEPVQSELWQRSVAGRRQRPEDGRSSSTRFSTATRAVAMNHFDYRNGVLHAEAVNLVGTRRRGRHAVLLLFDRDAGAPLPGVHRRLRRREGARLLRHEGEFQPVGAAHAGKTRRRRRRGLGRRVEARAGRRHSAASKIVFSGVGKTEAEMRAALAADILCINVESEPELELLSRARERAGQDGADFGSRQSGCRCRHPCQDLDRQVREQVRHSAGAGARGLCARGQAAGHSRDRRRHAYRQPDHRSGADGSRVPHAGRIRADAARRRPHHFACRFRRRPRHSLLHGPRSAAAARRLCRDGQARDAQSRLHADVRARPDDRRQCRHPGHPRDLCEAGRGQEVRHHRCRDERSDPPDAV